MGRKGAGAKKDVDVLLKFLVIFFVGSPDHPSPPPPIEACGGSNAVHDSPFKRVVKKKSPDLGGRKRLPTAPSLISGRRNDFDIVYCPATPETNQPLSRAPSPPLRPGKSLREEEEQGTAKFLLGEGKILILACR